MGKIVINVSGHLFVTTNDTLLKFPETKLGRLASESEDVQEHFFDADEDVFKEVLRYHRTGELHAPRNMCFETFCKELKFWNLDKEEIKFCCQSSDLSDRELERQFKWFDQRILLERSPTIRDRIWYFLTDPTGPYTRHKKASATWTVFYTLMVVLQSISLASFTLPVNARLYMQRDNATFFQAMKLFLHKPCIGAANQKLLLYSTYNLSIHVFVPFFILELVIRLFSCPEKKRFVCSLHMVDLLIVLADAAQYVLLFISNNAIDFNNAHPHLCLSMNVMRTVTFAIAQLRCVRILAITTICR